MRRTRRWRSRPGHHLVTCDLSGWVCWDDETIETWDGLIVYRKFYEERHPQDFVRGTADDQSVYPVRPETGRESTCEPIYEFDVFDYNQFIFMRCADQEN